MYKVANDPQWFAHQKAAWWRNAPLDYDYGAERNTLLITTEQFKIFRFMFNSFENVNQENMTHC